MNLSKSFVLKETKKIVDTIKYKPNCKFVVQRLPHIDAIEIKMWQLVEDAYGAHENAIPVCIAISLNFEMLNESQLRTIIIDRVYHLIKRFEEHEMNEWFLVDGMRIYDPHRILTATIRMNMD